jgi:putative Mn2+ efflux pump MntP
MTTLLIGITLSLDAFSIAVLKGLVKSKLSLKYIVTIALYFGIFQALMPYLGFQIGNKMYDTISLYDHYIILILLTMIGINMCLDSFKKDNDLNDNINIKEMLILALATSIDAFTVGITYSFFNINIYLTCLLIGIITFIISAIGVVIGNKIGTLFNYKVELIGGIFLIILAIKIFLSHI